MQTLTSADEKISLELPAGAYTIYALMGVSEDIYSLPTIQNAGTDAVISLKAGNNIHQELEAGRANITLEDGETTELRLTVTRIVSQITATISGLPNDIVGVSYLSNRYTKK